MDSENTEPGQDPEEALQQLRRWQGEQRARLIEQQKQQRELLLEKQKMLLCMLNSSSKEPSEEDGSQSVSVALSEGECRSSLETHTPKTIDELPLKKPRALQSFEQIMENSLSSKDIPLNSSPDPPEKKFTFLKRGEGLSKRFGRASNLTLKKDKTKAKRVITKHDAGKENKQPAKAQSSSNKICSNPSLAMLQAHPSAVSSKSSSKDSCSDIHFQQSILSSQTTNFANDIAFKDKELPISNRVNNFSQSEATVHLEKPVMNMVKTTTESVEDMDSLLNFHVPYSMKNIHDSTKDGGVSHSEEELAIFELLERFATINASFSSSSSLIGQLIEKGVNHLPSPSKVINFLSKKRLGSQEDSADNVGSLPVSKSQKKVHFAEVLEEQRNEDSGGPWLEDLAAENTNGDYSPYVSNTLQRRSHIDEESPIPTYEDKPKLDESPTSPIGFPDYRKLFGNPVRTLWARENVSSPGDETAKDTQASEIESEILKDSALPIPLPVDDPRLVYQGSLLRSRLSSLEREIANYRRESESLRRARKEHEELKVKLEQDQEKFKRYTENEKRRLQLLHSEEQKRIRSEQIKNLPQLKENEEEITKLKEELKQVKDEHRQKENKWMASQTKFQEKIRTLEIRNRELSDALEKLRSEEQNLRRRLNASLRPGAAVSKGQKISEDRDSPLRPGTPTLLKSVNQTPEYQTSSPAVNNCLDASGHPGTPLDVKQNDNSTNPGAVSTAVLPDGTKIMLYPNGNRKEIWPNGKGSQVIYYNGDIKQKLADGSIVYTYADSKTKHTTKPDGTDILEFANGQIETTYTDGRSQVQYSGGAQKMKYPDGREEAQWPDGTKLWTDGKGHGVMTFPSGMKEIYTPICKRREYPDGTVKTVYEDGRSETRYGNGRIRVKDSAGNIITDTGTS